jgi:hypothetical protein
MNQAPSGIYFAMDMDYGVTHISIKHKTTVGRRVKIRNKLGQSCAKLRLTYAGQPDGFSSLIRTFIDFILDFDPRSKVNSNH